MELRGILGPQPTSTAQGSWPTCAHTHVPTPVPPGPAVSARKGQRKWPEELPLLSSSNAKIRLGVGIWPEQRGWPSKALAISAAAAPSRSRPHADFRWVP